MAKKKQTHSTTNKKNKNSQDTPATLKDLLSQDVVDKLTKQADELKLIEENHKEEVRKQAQEIRAAEQKRLENDFEHLLNNNNLDWRKYK
jgi:hypothetical protein